jgi:Ser/Thr protein kinase RdoA (MazF antagonist)
MISPSNLVSEHGGLEGTYVPVKKTRALQMLEENYGILGALKRFETEKDDTFRVITTDRQKFVLKIANSGETFDEIDFQHRLLNYAETRDPSLPIPRIIKTRDGRDIFQITDVDGTLLYVWLLSFIDGTPLCETQSNARERVKIGKMLARIRHGTEGFSHAHEDRYYAWDVQHLLTLEHLLDEVDSPDQRDLLSRGLERFRSIEPRLRNCRKQVLHNDFSKSNIIVDHDDPVFVKGIIDFGDLVKTAIAVDVATALLNQLPERPSDDLFYRGRNVMEGYLSIAELNDEELALIPHLVMARVVTRALLTLWRAKLFPDNQRYIMRNTEQGWHQLDWFMSRSPEQVSDILISFSIGQGAQQ